MVLQNHGYDSPQIEVISESPRLEMLQNRIRQSGMRPVRAALPLDPELADPVLIDTAIATSEQISGFAREWDKIGAKRLLIILGQLPDQISGVNLLHLRDVDQLPTLPARIAIRQRELRRQREFELRAETADRLGLEAQDVPAVNTLRALYLGEGSPSFLPLKAALKDKSIETVAALSRFTASDHLSSGQFSAIILHPHSLEDEATHFLTRFNPHDHSSELKLFLIEEASFSKALPPQYVDKVTALLDASAPAEDLVDAILQHVGSTGSQPSGRTAAAKPRPMELFSRPFLESHLTTQFDEADTTGAPFCLVAVRVRKGPQSIKQLSPIIASLLRDTDMAANLDEDHICISLPATPYRGAIQLARRIESAVGENIEWRVIERRQFHTVETLLQALVAKPTLQSLRRLA